MSGEPKTLTAEVWAGRVEVLVDKEGRVIHKVSFELPPGFTFAEPTADGVRVVARDEAAEPKPIGWDDVPDEDVMAALVTALTNESALRLALLDLLNASHRGYYDASLTREAVAQAEALIAPDLDEDARRKWALAAIHRHLAGGENEK